MLHDLLAKMGEAFCQPSQEISTQNNVTEATLAELLPLPRLSTAESLNVYRRNLEGALLGALREIFPVCAALVGENCFRAIARAYGEAHPARHPDLGKRGDAFPHFLQTFDALQTVPYLPDMARLELAWHQAFTAPSAPLLTDDHAQVLSKIVAQYPAHWRFCLPPSAQCLTSPYPLLQIWQAHQLDETATTNTKISQHKIESNLQKVRFDQEPDHLLIWRRALSLRIDRVEAQFWPVLIAIEAGKSVAELLELSLETQNLLQDEIEDAEASDFEPILNLFREFFARGWIAACEEISN